MEEIREYTRSFKIDVVIFDDDLTPSQLRNLEKIFKCKIYDRSLLILDIFLKRAQTAQAKTQVELARYQYLMPRLTRMWTHLERQRGGTGTRGGAGEKEIETDRRVIRNQITILKGRLNKINKQSATQRKSRSNNHGSNDQTKTIKQLFQMFVYFFCRDETKEAKFIEEKLRIKRN